MLAFTLVRLARPMHIGSRPRLRCTRLAGITIRPAATSSRTCSAVRCGSRSATRFISGVTRPRRACSSWVTGWKPEGGVQRPSILFQSLGMKSQAVLPEGCGMPGVSGDANERGSSDLAAEARNFRVSFPAGGWRDCRRAAGAARPWTWGSSAPSKLALPAARWRAASEARSEAKPSEGGGAGSAARRNRKAGLLPSPLP